MVSAEPHARIYWIDALKAVVVVGICLFHTALVFSPGTWIVNNPQRSVILGAFAGLTFQWGIALLFLLAGAATWFGLRSRTALGFAASRSVRLGVPLLVGLALLSPLQSYIQHSRSLDLGGLPHTYLTFWTSVHATWSPSSAYDYVYHLWFLTHLLAISLLTLPVAVWLGSARGRRLAAQVVRLVDVPGGFLLGALPIAVVQVALHPRFPQYQDWSDLAAWAVLYLEGFVIVANERLHHALRRSVGPALLTVIVLSVAAGILYASGEGAAWDSQPDDSPRYLALEVARSAYTWAWVVFLLGVATRWLNADSGLARWGADRPLPFYVLSHPVVVVLAWYVVTWNAGVWLKFAVIATVSITVTLALCEVVGRYGPLRFLFGLSYVPKPRHHLEFHDVADAPIATPGGT